MTFHCDACAETCEGQRVVVSTEATDANGVDVVVAKRWVLCRSCGDEIFVRIGEASPWDDSDFKTLVLPDEEPVGGHMGGFA